MNVSLGCGNTLRCIVWLIIVGMGVPAAVVVRTCAAVEKRQMVAHLYFADAGKPFLTAEERVLAKPDDPLVFGRRLVMELIKGSTRGNLATIPTGTQLKAFFMLDDGTAVVDFSSQLRENHPGGCRLEQLTLFSIVNSLVLNVPEIERVKFLINGAEARTLTGHLPLEFPFTADMLLIR